MTLRIASPSFHDQGDIPSAFTCEGPNRSPALTWSGAPPGTRSLALIVDDPDAPDPSAPQMTWVHWVLWDLPPDCDGLPEAVGSHLPQGVREGLNDWKRPGWGGPCPPVGRHRYFFKLYALDTPLGPLATANKAGVEHAMRGHVLAQAQLVGTYQKQQRR